MFINTLNLLDGLIRSQFERGSFCNQEGFILFTATIFKGSIHNYNFKALGAQKISPTRTFLPGRSSLDALELTRSFLLVMKDHYPQFFHKFSQYQVLEFYRTTSQWPKCKFIKFAKYYTANLPAVYLHQEERPKQPDGWTVYNKYPEIYSGQVRRFIQHRLNRRTGRNDRFWNSVLQGVKRSTRVADEDFVFGEYEGHSDRLQDEPDGDLDPKIHDYIRRALGGFKFGKFRLLEASRSASVTTKRSQGGQRADVYHFLEEHYGYAPRGTVEYTNGIKRGIIGPNIPEDIEQLFKDVIEEIPQPYRVQVHAVLEPLKVRLITKGEALPYWISRSAQKDMWSYLQNFEQFCATGRPLQTADIYGLLEREKAIEGYLPTKFDKWVSGDYSAATDCLDIRVTMDVFEQMLDKSDFSDNLKYILRGVIGPQYITYPKVKKLKEGTPFKTRYSKSDYEWCQVEPFLQKNGQLMGSTLSFPILCIVNIVCYWYALEEYTGHTISLESLPCLVNGDDILFRANDEFYSLWQEKIKAVGFKKSIGKNYIHNQLFLMNSMLHKYDFVRNELTYIPFFNVGLLTGRSKLGSYDECDSKPLWDWFEAVMDGACDKEQAYKYFLHYHNDTIRSLTKNGKLNLFADRFYGGVGFKFYDELKDHVKFTTYQRKLATYMKWFLTKEAKHGVNPGKYILRLIPSSERTADDVMTIDLGHYDKYKFIKSTQPLNVGEDLELKLTYNLPILARLPKDFDKKDLEIRAPKGLPRFKDIGKQLLMDPKKMYNSDLRIVSYHEPTIGEKFSQLDDDLIVPDYEISETNERYSKKSLFFDDETKDFYVFDLDLIGTF